MLKDVVPKNMQKREQWALRALTVCAGEWITEHNSKKCPSDILETEDAGRLATVILAYYRTAQEKGQY